MLSNSKKMLIFGLLAGTMGCTKAVEEVPIFILPPHNHEKELKRGWRPEGQFRVLYINESEYYD